MVAVGPETGFHRRPQKDHSAGAGDAWRRRSDRSLCQRRAIVGKAAEERDAEDLEGLPARHAARLDQVSPSE
jgi:hypothetical protein